MAENLTPPELIDFKTSEELTMGLREDLDKAMMQVINYSNNL
jgi:hypothetical protein